MSTKKSTKQITSVVKGVVPHASQDQVVEILRLLQQKVMGSSALNGGFDTLMYKIEKIEEGQIATGTKVDSIHDAIYHPDEGLYARVKAVELAKTATLSGVEKVLGTVEKLEKDVTHIQHQRETEAQMEREASELSKENDKLVKAHAQQLKELTEFKTKVCTIAKWLAVTIGGGILTGIGKIIYDFASGHITIH